MFFELISTIVAGVAAGLFVWAVNRTLKGRFPKWLVPVAAGAAMLLATISSEYGWYDRTVATMPEGMVVAQTVEERTFYRPWTYMRPFVSRFVAVDLATALSIFTENGAAALKLADVAGSIEVGKSADLIVLNQPLFEIAPEAISDTQVLMTGFEGQTVYEAPSP